MACYEAVTLLLFGFPNNWSELILYLISVCYILMICLVCFMMICLVHVLCFDMSCFKSDPF